MLLSDRKEEGADRKYRLFVTAANTNQVYVVSVNDANAMKIQETINVGMTPHQPAGRRTEPPMSVPRCSGP